ncbi:C4-dicarboxylate-binding periplasmic protein DctP [bioreactor metagenome]|uniref:C4-dicarboxylate-binding periplasmic protein DctP n=1 Tax=bioreactor metagenome TaxID=1076179 RepID=A0A644TEA1_9ZZZZ|nr:TRAP transporter substrate-binding protein [Desulfitobacterium hafniense]MEA5025296.1 TRAP transporter substrate-binding protein [Desulfitobacterium hafniense]
MKKVLGLVLTLALSLTFTGCASKTNNNGDSAKAGSTEKQIVMKIGHTQIEQSPRHAVSLKIKEYVEKESNGRIAVQIYPNSQLGNSKEQVEGLQTGSIEMVVFPTTSVTDFQPIFTLPDIPYLFPTDQEKLLKLYKSDAFKTFMAAGDDKGFKALATLFEGYATISSKIPVTEASQLKDMKLRIIGSNIAKTYYTNLGVPPNVIAFSEVYTSLQTGRINSLDIPISQMYENKFYEVCENMTETKHFALTSLVMVNKSWYDALPGDLQKIIADAAEMAAPEAANVVNATTEKARKDMPGVQFHQPTDDLVNQLKEQTGKMEEEYVKVNGEKGKQILDGIKQAVQVQN